MPPETAADLTLWPYLLRRECEAHGVAAVWKTGLAILGYPPLWDPPIRDIRTIIATLNTKGTDDGTGN